MKKEKRGTKFIALILAIALFAMALTACSQEPTEEQSKALIALESVVSWYESYGSADHWEDLMALCFANYADGVAVNWRMINLPETETDFTDASSYVGAIITDTIKGEGPTALYANQLLEQQDLETGAFASGENITMHVYSMLALNISPGSDSYDYTIAAEYLLARQAADGGFAADDSNESDVFLTGLAAAALAPYFDSVNSSAALDKLSQFYIDKQDSTGGYLDREGNRTAEMSASAICGLTALKLPLPEAEGSGLTPLDALLKFQNEDGTFRQYDDGEESGDPQATRRAAIALCDIVNDMNTFQLLASDNETYRIENADGPEILLSIEYPEESEQENFSGPFIIEPNSHAFDAIIFYGLSAGVPVTFSGSVNSRSIEGINEVENRENSFWVYYVNEQLSPFPPSAVPLEEGDRLRWVYVSGDEALDILESLDSSNELAGEDSVSPEAFDTSDDTQNRGAGETQNRKAGSTESQ